MFWLLTSYLFSALFLCIIHFIEIKHATSSGSDLWCFYPQDNVFVTVVASVQYRALAEKAADAFYKLSNTRAQIQAYVFDGTNFSLAQHEILKFEI